MSLHLVPHTMRARHAELGHWETLALDRHAFYIWKQPATECYYIETGDKPLAADLGDFDSFEAVQ
jgi:hypothetical protein